MNKRTAVAIALGSNLGDRDAHLDFAVTRLSALLDDLRVSSRHDTEPVDAPGEQRSYLNAAATGLTTLGPHELLRALQRIEADCGRERPFVNAPRTLDLDLILYGDFVIDDAELVVPHPRFRERAFVLVPLAEVAPTMVDPVTHATVEGLLRQLRERTAG